jgi:aerotaxis receptor
MRNTGPVTQREYELPDNATLMSTTDPKSRIRYANEAFVEVSGYSRDELAGQPHNLVRHPDMPAQAFEDMWRTLQGGEPWTGLVKNRRKDGDHYWVRANVTPIIRGGRTVGHMSVRTKATRAEIDTASALYRAVREDKAGDRRFFKGLVIRTGLAGVLSCPQRMSVRWRIRAALCAVLPLLGGGAWALGLSGGAAAVFTGLAGLALALASGILEQQIARPLEQLQAQALRVASGESREVQHLDRVDEIGMTLRTVGQLGLMFRWLLSDVSQQAEVVHGAAAELAQGNTTMTAGVEQVAAHVHETAESMAVMTSTLQESAAAAAQASELAALARQTAEQGGRAVGDVVATMDGIANSSKRVSDIVSVIDGLALQTNLLALNAAVEAARAGEAGRGFAVVAGEVRGLAQKSAAASKEIRALIEANTAQTVTGAGRAASAGKTMDELVARVQAVSELFGRISGAAVERGSNVAQVNESLTQLDALAQQSAAQVEQDAAAAQGLQEQAARLARAVSVFR